MRAPTPQPQLTNEQIERLLVVMETLNGTNSMASVAWTAAKKAQTMDEKRRIIATVSAHAYELMLAMNMAIKSKVPPEQIKANLKSIGEGGNGSTP